MAQPPPASCQEGPFRSFRTVLHVSSAVRACQGCVPGRDHTFASLGTSYLEKRQSNTRCGNWNLWKRYREAQCFGECFLMLVHSPGIWVHFLALQKASCAASGGSLCLGARFLPCCGESDPFHWARLRMLRSHGEGAGDPAGTDGSVPRRTRLQLSAARSSSG